MEITYEILFEALMLEKNRPELQNLDKDFFMALNTYINDKKKILEERKGTLDMFSEAEKEKTSKQLINIKKIVKELYERREKKIVDMALTRSRTGSVIMDTSSLREEEKFMFNELIGLLDKHRSKTFSLVEAQEEGFKEAKAMVGDGIIEKGIVSGQEEKRERISEEEDEDEDAEEDENENQEPVQKQPEKNENNEKNEKSIKVIRFIHSVPRFLGKELEVYGPFEEEDISTLPSEIADILIRKGRAEEISG